MPTTNIKVNGNGKVILDTHPESDQHQNWTCSRGSPPAPTHQIWWWSMNPFLRYLADKRVRTDTQTDTRRWPQDLTAYGAQVTSVKWRVTIWLTICGWHSTFVRGCMWFAKFSQPSRAGSYYSMGMCIKLTKLKLKSSTSAREKIPDTGWWATNTTKR